MQLQGKHTHEVATRIIRAFRHPENLPKALAPIFIHRKDDVPCRRWSWHNQLLCAIAGTDDARGYEQWRKAERFVKRGGKAFWILAPCVKKVTEETDDDDEAAQHEPFGSPIDDENGVRLEGIVFVAGISRSFVCSALGACEAAWPGHCAAP